MELAGASRDETRERRAFWAAFGLCSVVALCVLWLPKYLPLADLPQHAAQIAIWKHIDDPAFGFHEVFRLHYFTPYLLGYGMARLFAEVFSVPVSVKLVLTLSVLGLPWSLLKLLQAAGGRRWFCLVGFPTAFGYAFLWGFFNYIVALPLGVLYLAFVLDYTRRFERARALLLAAFTLLLFAAHLIVFVMCGLSAAALIGFSAKGLKDALVRGSPLVAGLLLSLVWASRYQKGLVVIPSVYRYGVDRLVEAPSLLLGYPNNTPGTLVGLLILLLFVTSGVRLASRRERLVPLLLWAGFYFGLPQDYSNVAFLYPRLAILVLPCAIVATEPARPWLRPMLLRLALTSVAVGWMLGVLRGFMAFDRDARDYDVVMAAMQPRRRVRSLIFERGSDYTEGGVPFMHFPAWYQVEKGGTTSYSFAYTLLSVAVFRDSHRTVRASIDWNPWDFNVEKEQNDYDYYVVRAGGDLRSDVFRGATRPVELLAHRGMWWLFRLGEPAADAKALP